jgi:hypothetical protein
MPKKQGQWEIVTMGAYPESQGSRHPIQGTNGPLPLLPSLLEGAERMGLWSELGCSVQWQRQQIA